MSSTSLPVDTVKVELDTEILQACRICLAWDGKLYNIKDSGLDQMYVDLMGTTLSVWDGFPQHLCGFCRALLLKAHALRARCRRAHEVLKQALMHQHFITNDFIRTVDRSAHKLTHSLSSIGGKADVKFYINNDDTQTPDEPETDFIDIQDNILENDTLVYNHVKEFDFSSDHESVKNDFQNDYDLDEFKVDDVNVVTVKNKISDVDIIKPLLSDVEIVETPVDQIKKIEPVKRKKRPARKKLKDKNGEIKDSETIVKVVKKKKDKRSKDNFCREEHYKEFEKKYDFQVECLTDAEMAADMEKRKLSDKYLKGKYKCELCYKSFLASHIYDNHMKIHSPARGENVCLLCHSRFHFPMKLRHHVQNAHRLRFRCAKCGERVHGKQAAELHAAYHAGATFPCAHCDKRFLKKTSRTSHMRAAHPAENAAGGTCEECGETFTSRTGLKAHKTRSHIKSILPELRCRRCCIHFDNMEALKRHKETNPDSKCNPRLSACERCGETCADADALILHKHTQHAVDLFTCDTCTKSFTSKASLGTHIDRVHRHIRPPKADYSLAGGQRDWLHWATVCEHCGKRLSCLATLKIHMNRHTGERPFKCSLCPKAYMTPNGLNNHHAAHTGERKWQCPECPATFLHQSSVYQHRKIHTGERSHQCKICDKYFTQSGSLYTHVKYVHRRETPPPRKRNKKTA